MGFRRFLVRYRLAGVVTYIYADTIEELERVLVEPRKRGIGWSFKSVG